MYTKKSQKYCTRTGEKTLGIYNIFPIRNTIENSKNN